MWTVPNVLRMSSTNDPHGAVLHIRDYLRDLFGLLGIAAQVEVSTLGDSEVIAIAPLELREARRLADALNASEATWPRAARP